mgnify:CR=1 FL=1
MDAFEDIPTEEFPVLEEVDETLVETRDLEEDTLDGELTT